MSHPVMRAGRSAQLLALLLAASLAAAAPFGPQEPLEARPHDQPAELIINSERQWRQGNLVVAEGSVDVRYRDMSLQADRIEFDSVTRQAVASGHVTLVDKDERLTGSRVEMNIDTRLGVVHDAWGYGANEIFFRGETVERVSDTRYLIRDATVTSCNQPSPYWDFKAGGATLEVDKYVRMKHLLLRVKRVPVLYVPAIQYPTKRRRATGFLFPSFGTNNSRGFTLTNSFFWAIGRSYDATLSHDYYASRGYAVRSEFRYVPAESAQGLFNFVWWNDRETNKVRQSYRAQHSQEFGRAYRLTGRLDYQSDDSFDQDFSNRFGRATNNRRDSRVELVKRQGMVTWSLKARQLRNLSAGGTTVTDRLPSFAARWSGVSFGPLRLDLNGGYDYIRDKRANEEEPRLLHRLDAFPVVSATLRPTPWLRLNPRAGVRGTFYSDSLVEGTTRELSGESYFRTYGQADVTLTGPVLSRVFHAPGGGYAEKYKHVIEPVIGVSHTTEIEPGRVLRIDSTESEGVSRTQLSMAVLNKFFAKRALGSVAVPYEFLTVRTSTTVTLDPNRGLGVVDDRALGGYYSNFTGSRWGPLSTDVRFVPNRDLTLTYRITADMNKGQFDSQNLRWAYRAGRWDMDVSWQLNFARDTSPQRQELQGSVRLDLLGTRMRLVSRASYDVTGRNLRQTMTSLDYFTQCCGFGVGYQRFDVGTRDDQEIRFSVSLKNVGKVFEYSFGGDDGSL